MRTIHLKYSIVVERTVEIDTEDEATIAILLQMQNKSWFSMSTEEMQVFLCSFDSHITKESDVLQTIACINCSEEEYDEDDTLTIT